MPSVLFLVPAKALKFARQNSPYVKESGFRNPAGNFLLWIPESRNFFLVDSESWVLESGIQLKVPLTKNPESSIWNPECI